MLTSLQFFMNSPASTITEVVPSPTSASWLNEISASVFAAGCTISRSFTIVAPSLEIVTYVKKKTPKAVP